MGINVDLEDHQLLLKQKILTATRNFAVEEAMTPNEPVRALETGMRVVLSEQTRNKIDTDSTFCVKGV